MTSNSVRQEAARPGARPAAYADPWLWTSFGFATCLLAAAVSLTGVSLTMISGLVTAGLLAVGIGAAIRLGSSDAAGDFSARPLVLAALLVFQAITAVLVTWTLIAAIGGFDPVAPGRSTLFQPPPVRPGLGILLWLLVGPMSFVGLWRTWKQLTSGAALTPAFEKAALLMQAALACLFAGFALGQGADTITVFLAVLTGFLAAATSWLILSINGRWLVLSAVIVVHFLMVGNATLAAPPSSWSMGQLWTRMSRPYLEFMYLNNAYHFYAPDPGPASYLWFRVYFDTGAVDPQTNLKELQACWVKVPDIDPNTGNYPYRVALEYQRHLSVTENTVGGDSPPLFVNGQPAESFSVRVANSPGRAQFEVLGKKHEFVLEVPFHPFINNETQYHVPALAAKRLFESYVRHIAARFDSYVKGRDDLPTSDFAKIPKTYKIDSIRVYLVTHMIAPWNMFAAGMEPTDPEFYRPYYMGRYSPDGKLMREDEPLLYWMLPILRKDTSRPDSPIVNHAAIHAGDEKCVYYFNPEKKTWDLGVNQ